jgi:hypothetical protein
MPVILLHTLTGNLGKLGRMAGQEPGREVGEKTPPFAGAKRRGRNREEANTRAEVNPPSLSCQSMFSEKWVRAIPEIEQTFTSENCSEPKDYF